jgi:hypothetical protein
MLATGGALCGLIAACGLGGSGLADFPTDDGGGTDHTSMPMDAAGDMLAQRDAPAEGDGPSGPDGTGDDGQTDADAQSGPDGSEDVDAPNDVASEPDSPTCVASIPVGWSLVEYEAAQGDCPQGNAPDAVVTNPMVGATACTCSCNNTVPPTCDDGVLQTYYSNDNSCGTVGAAIAFSGACVDLGASQVAPHFGANALAPSGGQCMSTEAQDNSQLTSTPAGLCNVPGPDQESVCNGGSPNGFEACVVSAGDVSCPIGPFAVRTVVYGQVSLQCGACGACTSGGSCGSATLTLYSANQPPCSANNLVVAFNVDGNCYSDGADANLDVEYASYAATLTPPQGTCSVPPPSAAFMPTGTQTVCCRN